MTSTTPNLKTYHVKSYPAISPEQPSLSMQGKTTVIAGVGSGNVGYAIARSFAKSGAMNIALIGMNESALTRAKSELKAASPTTNIEYFVTDMRFTESVGVTAHQIRASLGAWDVFVQAASHSPIASTLVGADTDDWWECFEQNVRSTQHFAKHFIPKKRPNATYISLVSRMVHQPVFELAGSSAFAGSQAAVLKVNEFLAAEQPDLRVFNVDPGTYHAAEKTQRTAPDSGSRGLANPDEILELCGDFCVRLVSSKQDFLRGQFLSSNWDATELLAKKAAISADPSLLAQ